MKNIIMGIIFVIALALVFIGQKHIGYAGLGVQLIGLFGLIGLLYTYNKRYK